jgi:hypothetical protein
VPEEYVQTMRESMLKRCPVSSYEQVRGVFAKDLGESPETVSTLPDTLFASLFEQYNGLYELAEQLEQKLAASHV